MIVNRQEKSQDFESNCMASEAKNEALDWFLRLKEDHATDTIIEFEHWLKAEPSRQQAYQQLEHMYAIPSLKQATQTDIILRGNQQRQNIMRRRFLPKQRMAVVLVLCLSLLVIAGLQFDSLTIWWKADFQTSYGEQQMVKLSDGSAVLLNTGSAIAVDFHDKSRRIVLLKGEAFFDVQHNLNRPFIVSGRHSNVQVTGTAFSVRTDDEEDTVVLERGGIAVRLLNDSNKSAQLISGQGITISKTTMSPVRTANLAVDLAWKDGRIIFHDRPFAEALADLKQYYSGTVLVLANTATLPAVSGNYRIDEPEAAIRTLAAASQLTATRLPGNIFILR